MIIQKYLLALKFIIIKVSFFILKFHSNSTIFFLHTAFLHKK